ncbi:MAG: hypothetical protein M3R08_05100 [Bacteroidota bacterium]|nr:hypothetical protein [Bacteroidota bacterium]
MAGNTEKSRTASFLQRILKLPWALLVCLLFLFAAHNEVMHLKRHRSLNVLQWDVAGYHHYLPAAFIYNDLQDLEFLRKHIPFATRHHDEIEWFGIYTSKITGHHYTKFPYGVALLNSPGFLLAHIWTFWIDTNHPPDGYSEAYQHAVEISTFLYVLFGLLVLRRFLQRYLPEIHVAIALAAIAFGTNLFFYSTHNAGMSHGYVFFLFAIVLERTDAWHRKPSLGAAMVLGGTLGVILITRPIDALIGIVPLLWHITSRRSLIEKSELIKGNKLHLVIGALMLILPIIPQMLYWKVTTGSFIFYSYGDEGFAFHPENIFNGLFSYRKGWFVYTPLAFIGVLALLFMILRRKITGIVIPSFIFLLLIIPAVFSWHQWWYGGGFGARVLVESLAVIALPIGWLSRTLFDRSRWAWLLHVLIIYGCIELNMLQQHQYTVSLLHYDSMNKERYWEIFLKRDWEGVRKFPYEEEQ